MICTAFYNYGVLIPLFVCMAKFDYNLMLVKSPINFDCSIEDYQNV